MMEVVVTNGVIRRTKLQLNGHYQQTNTQLFTEPDAPNQQHLTTEGKANTPNTAE